MAVPDTAQALVGTFSLGVLLAASAAALVIFAWKHAVRALRDGLRLALISFLALSSAWALTGFITTTVNPRSMSACQVSVVFSTIFDQIARYSVEQFLLWASPAPFAPKALQIGPQLLLIVRLILGVAYTALIRPAFDPTCVPRTQIPYLAVALIIVDAIIVVLLAIKAIFNNSTNSNVSTRSGKQNKSVFLSIAGLAIWMGMSVTYLLGFESIDFVFRTAIPAAGELILILILTLFSGILFEEHDSRLDSARNSPSFSRSVETPPLRYDELKREDPQNTRFISRNADGTFPSISRPLPSGADKSVVPTIVSQSSWPAPAELNAAPKSPWKFFSNNERRIPRTPKTDANGRIQIGAPIVHDDPSNEHNPLRRIQTIDLATARQQDRDRRQLQVVNAARSPDLIATRRAPEPPRPSTAGGQGLSRAQGSLARKPLRATAPAGALSPQPPLPRSQLEVGATAASTSLQLSPGSEAMRRRSPRQSQARPQTSHSQADFQAQSSYRGVARTSIAYDVRASLVPDLPIPQPPPFKFSNTPNVAPRGLPTHPRAGPRMFPPKQLAKVENSTEVMLVTDIVYKDPDVVRNILHKKAKSAPLLPNMSGPVMHRPRPIPRHQMEDRQVFPAETLRNHRRSQSSGSINMTKSMFFANPGNPSRLPPLPEPPRTTESNTFPANALNLDKPRRLSGRPEDPPCPALIAREKTQAEDLRREVRRAQDQLKLKSQAPLPAIPASSSNSSNSSSSSSRVSVATTKDSIRTISLFGFEDEQDVMERLTMPAPPVELEESDWRRKTGSDTRSSMSTHRSQRKSSPVIPDFRYLPFSPSDSVPPTATTTWNVSTAMNVAVSRQQAQSTYIQAQKLDSPMVDAPETPTDDTMITVMLDPRASSDSETLEAILTARAYVPFEADSKPAVESPLEAEIPMMATTPLSAFAPHHETLMPTRFHRQVGDECPCFSTRKSAIFKKRVPPPPPLPLSMRTRAVIVQTEPSPLESPEGAYQMIQEQLKNMDRRAEDMNEDDQRRDIALLEDLEKEMGQQENRWQNLHNKVDRDSISTFASTPGGRSVPPSALPRDSYRSSVGSTAGLLSKFLQPGRANPPKPSVVMGQPANTLDYLRGSNKDRLSQAEWYLQRSAQLSAVSAGSTMTKITMADIGSPSPPDSGEEDFEIAIETGIIPESPVSLDDFPMMAPVQVPELWQPKQLAFRTYPEPLWAAPVELPASPDVFSSFANIPVMVRTRRTFDEPLFVNSRKLWTEPVAKPSAPSGLWQKPQPAPIARARSFSKPRPLTVRPARRQKRVSQLADILESPKPLPDKRGTLGIFQFPWGEKSENPVIFHKPGRITAMPGTMSTGASPLNAILEARARQLAAQEQAMRALAEQERNPSRPVSTEGDDEFDENTLWEIAHLLRADHIPSRESLFPGLDGYEDDDDEFDMEDYAAEFLSDSEIEEEDEEETQETEDDESMDSSDEDELPYQFVMVSGSPRSVASSAYSPTGLVIESSLLWDKTSGKPQKFGGLGLGQPDEVEWKSYSQDHHERPVFRHLNENIAEVQSDSLWQRPTARTVVRKDTPLWASKEIKSPKPVELISIKSCEPLAIVAAPQVAETSAPNLLWNDSPVAEQTVFIGLSQPNEDVWSQYKEDDLERPTFRHLNENLVSVDSQKLWKRSSVKAVASTSDSLWTSATPSTTLSAPGLLWKESSMVERTTSIGLSQPSEAEWSLYTETSSERPKFRHLTEQLISVDSQSLWEQSSIKATASPSKALWTSALPKALDLSKTTAVTQSTTTTMAKTFLWDSSVTEADTKQSEIFGLAQPEDSEWQSYVKKDEHRPVFRHAQNEVVHIMSNALWGLPLSQQLVEEPETMLWGGASNVPSSATVATELVVEDIIEPAFEPVAEPVVEPTVQTMVEPAAESKNSSVSFQPNSSLWTKSERAVSVRNSLALFDAAKINGKDLKRTSKEVVRAPFSRNSPPRDEPLGDLATNALWAKRASKGLEAQKSFWMNLDAPKEASTVAPASEVVDLAVQSPIVVDEPIVSVAEPIVPVVEPVVADLGFVIPGVSFVTPIVEPVVTPVVEEVVESAIENVVQEIASSSNPVIITTPVKTATLWSAPQPVRQIKTFSGLWHMDSAMHSCSRRHSVKLTPIDHSRKPRTAESTIPTITSDRLWMAPRPAPQKLSWLELFSDAPIEPESYRKSLTETISSLADTISSSSTVTPRWSQPINQRVSRVQSFADDDFFNHFGTASTPITPATIHTIEEEFYEEATTPKPPSNSTWLAAFGWKKSS